MLAWILTSIAAAAPAALYDDHPGLTAADGEIADTDLPTVPATGVNTGFGDVFGAGARLFVDGDESGALVFALQTGPGAFNDLGVIYLDTQPGGLATTATLSDTGDAHRRAISGLGVDGQRAVLEFPATFRPDYAIALDGAAFAGLWAIVPDGANHRLVFVKTLQREQDARTHELHGLSLADLEAGPDGFGLLGTYLNPANAFRSNEFLGASFSGANPGNGTVALTDASPWIPGPLPAGAFAFHAYDSDNPDLFAFVALDRIPAGARVSFTDNGWLAAGGFRTGEGVRTWTNPATMLPGDVVVVKGTTVTPTAPLTSSGSFDLSGSGDQVIAFQRSLTDPWLVAAIQMNSVWDADATSSNASALPPALAAYQVAISPERNNARYTCDVSEGLAEVVRTGVNNPSAWETHDSTPFGAPRDCAFDIATCGDGVCHADLEDLETCAADCAVRVDFETHDPSGWTIGASGGAAQPFVLADGGPDGPADAFLRYVADGSSSAGKLVVFNDEAPFTGDLRGWRQLSFQARVTGPDVVLRPIVESGSAKIALLEGVAVPGDGQWHTVRFNLTGMWSGASDAVLANVSRFRIAHNPNPTPTPPTYTGTLDLDDLDNTPPAPFCGDGIANLDEVCDLGDLAGADCTDFGYASPFGLSCEPGCGAYDTSACLAECGNSVAEPGEACDGGGIDAADCDADCTPPEPGDGVCNVAAGETAANSAGDCVTTCGDGLITGDEACDGDALGGADCTDGGYSASGTVTCASDCAALEFDACESTCGDGNPEPGEACDGGGVNTAACDADCTAPEVGDGTCNAAAGETAASAPADCAAVCGDAAITHAEVCDGAAFGDATCATEGFDEGALACVGCTTLDTSGCAYTCGNDRADGDELCDGTDLGGATCADYGFSNPIGLGCSGTCDVIVSGGCTATCGDGTREPGEDCDDGDEDLLDGCTDACVVEVGWTCTLNPGGDLCTPDCGDGYVVGDEACDDDNTDPDDGCDPDCAVEAGWTCDDSEPSLCVEDPDPDTDTDTDPGTDPDTDTDIDTDTEIEGPPCGCAAAPGVGSGAGLVLIGLLVARRRRR